MQFSGEEKEEVPSSIVVAAETRIADVRAIESQLERVLASSHFCQSKRCQAFLKYVVTAYLDGGVERVKERCIGFEVFHRDADYDTARDSVVRTTAAEVRKRLAQYYQDPEHEQEVRIILPHGSYCPEFRAPAVSAVVSPPPTPRIHPQVPRLRKRWRWMALAGGASVLAIAVTLMVRQRPGNFDLFWNSVLQDRSEAVICIEQPLRIFRFTGPRKEELNRLMVGDKTSPPASREEWGHSPLTLSELDPTGAAYFSYGDLMASTRFSELLARKSMPFQVLGDRNTAYRDLRGRVAILLGEFNNQWTLSLMSGLPFYLDKNMEARQYEVRDRQNNGAVLASVSMDHRNEEFAIVSRVFDSTKETTVVAVVGSTYYGTIAGGEFLTRSAYMNDAFRSAPPNWRRKNFQVVIRASVVGGMPGPPQVRAMRFW